MKSKYFFDGTRKTTIKLLKMVFRKINKYSLKEVSNTSVGGLWDDKDKKSRIWVMVPSITALQVMRLAYYFQTEPQNIILVPDFAVSPNCDQCWWSIDILKPNSINWEWKP